MGLQLRRRSCININSIHDSSSNPEVDYYCYYYKDLKYLFTGHTPWNGIHEFSVQSNRTQRLRNNVRAIAGSYNFNISGTG